MKGDEKIIEHLNLRLAEELSAINQYIVHSEMCRNWGYERLHRMIEKRAMSEMKHAEKLIARILFLEGRPVVSGLVKVNIGSEVPRMHSHDLRTEETAIKGYTESIRLTLEVSDNGTRELLQEILKDEENHVDELEAQLAQIEQMGPQIYLVDQLRGEK
jgi:bacterioferritin